jgi:CheY-like chemotaxis protein
VTRRSLLLVEDDPDDEELTCRVLRRECGIEDITVLRDGAAALDFLLGSAQPPRPLPAVVLLDLNLPKLGGLEVLKAVRADPRTALLPVVVMTSSQQDADLLGGYLSGANGYVVKPVEYEAFTERVRRLGLFWMLANEPPRPGPLP